MNRFILLFFAIIFMLPQTSVQAAEIITLGDAHKLALSQNYDIKDLQENIYLAEVAIQKAWAVMIPNISANAAITRNNKESVIQGSAIVIMPLWQKGASLNANMVLFRPSSIPAIINAHKNMSAKSDSVKHAKSEILYAVTNAYFITVQAKKMLKVADQNVSRAGEYLALAKMRQKVGQAIRIDVLRAEIEVSKARKTLINSQTGFELARQSLGYLIAVDGEFDVVKPDKNTKLLAKSEAELLADATKKRLDIKAAIENTKIAKRASVEAWLGYLPTFAMQGNYNWNETANMAGDNTSWNIMFTATLPILENGLRIAAIRDSKAYKRMAKNEENRLNAQVAKQIKEALINFNKAKVQFDVSQKQVELSLENYALVKQQYEIGMVDNLTMLDASTALLASEQDLVVDELGLQLSVLALYQSSGHYISVE